jgi:hypothetical protein
MVRPNALRLDYKAYCCVMFAHFAYGRWNCAKGLNCVQLMLHNVWLRQHAALAIGAYTCLHCSSIWCSTPSDGPCKD